MKNITLKIFCSLFLVNYAIADTLDTGNIIHYSTDYLPKFKEEHYAAYVLKDDPCLSVKNTLTNENKRYCDIGGGMNLEKESPDLLISSLRVNSGVAVFSVSGFHGVQDCQLWIQESKIACVYRERVEPKVDPNELDRDDDEELKLDFSEL